jgi:hypothetical protein
MAKSPTTAPSRRSRAVAIVPLLVLAAGTASPAWALRQTVAPLAASSSTPDTELAAIERALAGADLDGTTRGELQAKADALRVALLERFPDDERASTWLVDRAVFTLAQLSSDGSDTSAMLGLPTDVQRARVQDTATKALRLLDQARDAANRATPRIEEQLLSRAGSQAEIEARAASAEARLRRIQDVELAQRIPYFRALARVLIAGSGSTPSQRDDAAKLAINELKAMNTPTLGADSARRVALGSAMLRQVIVDQATMDQAADLFGQVVAKAAAAPAGASRADSVDPLTLARARVGLRVLGADVPPMNAQDWRWTLAEAEGVARHHLMQSTSRPEARGEGLTRAMNALVAAASSPTPTPDEANVLRLLAYAKASDVAGPGTPASALPAEVAFGRAVTLARGTIAEAEQAAGLLGELADRGDASPSVRADALWERAVILARAGERARPREAFDALLTLVRGFPDSPRAVPAAVTAADLYQSNSTATIPPPPEWATQKPAFTTAVDFLLARAPEDRWRLAMLSLVLDELGTRPAAAQLERAQTLADQLTGVQPRTIGRQLLAAAMPRALPAARAAVESARASGDPVAMARAQSERTAITGIVARWASVNDPEWSRTLALDQAESLADQNDPSAPEAFRRLIGSGIDQPGSPTALRIRLGLARAQRASGENASAFATFRELAEQFERPPGETGRDPAYWAAWSGMLDILTVANTDGTRTDEIERQLRRLELLDPALGGAPFAERFVRIREGLKSLAKQNPPAESAIATPVKTE